MAHSQRSWPIAFIVEDEILIALDLERAMANLGYEVCGIATNDSRARTLAMKDHPEGALLTTSDLATVASVTRISLPATSRVGSGQD